MRVFLESIYMYVYHTLKSSTDTKKYRALGSLDLKPTVFHVTMNKSIDSETSEYKFMN